MSLAADMERAMVDSSLEMLEEARPETRAALLAFARQLLGPDTELEGVLDQIVRGVAREAFVPNLRLLVENVMTLSARVVETSSSLEEARAKMAALRAELEAQW